VTVTRVAGESTWCAAASVSRAVGYCALVISTGRGFIASSRTWVERLGAWIVVQGTLLNPRGRMRVTAAGSIHRYCIPR
jgi:hypothetical protein